MAGSGDAPTQYMELCSQRNEPKGEAAERTSNNGIGFFLLLKPLRFMVCWVQDCCRPPLSRFVTPCSAMLTTSALRTSCRQCELDLGKVFELIDWCLQQLSGEATSPMCDVAECSATQCGRQKKRSARRDKKCDSTTQLDDSSVSAAFGSFRKSAQNNGALNSSASC